MEANERKAFMQGRASLDKEFAEYANEIAELKSLVHSLYADYYDEWPDRAEEYYAERIAALGIEVEQ